MPTLVWWVIGACGLVLFVWVLYRKGLFTLRGESRAPEEFDQVSHPPQPMDESVQFTVYRPRSIAPDHWYTLLAFGPRCSDAQQ